MIYHYSEDEVIKSLLSKTDYFDICLFMGDLNYRIEKKSEFIQKCLSENRLKELLEHDQLKLESNSKRLSINGFEEAEITFHPTYKYIDGTDNYDSKECVQGWTDRILYKHKKNKLLSFVNKGYSDIKKLSLSDHKPVFGIFEADLIIKHDPIIVKIKNNYLLELSEERLEKENEIEK